MLAVIIACVFSCCMLQPFAVFAKMAAPLPEDYNGTGENSNSPAVILRVNEELLTCEIDEAEEVDGETYSPSDRRYAGMPTIAKTGDRLWATWRSGYTWEGKYNYFPICYSDDGGDTWVDPYMIVDHPDAKGAGIGVGTPQLWTDPDGNLWLFYTTGGVWAVKFTGADGDLSKMTWEFKHILYNNLIAKAPVVIRNEKGEEEWMLICYNTNDQGLGLTTTAAYVSSDKGESWSEKGRAVTDAVNLRKYAESSVYQTSDGVLHQVCRLDGGGGGLEVSTSSDYGKTWSSFTRYLEEPFSGPASKPHYISLGNGTIFAVNHASDTSRTDLTVYLSEDDGKTWPYRLMIDDRDDVSYPFAIYDDGMLYVVYDRDRAGAQEIRLARITIEDVKAGKITQENSVLRHKIYQKTGLKDIVSVTEDLSAKILTLGVSREEAAEFLPAVLHVTDEDGNTYTLAGKWSIPVSFSKTAEGEYIANFRAQAMPENLQDAHGLLSVSLKVQKGGSGAAVIAAIVTGSVVLCAAVVFLVLRLRKRRIKKNG